MIFLLFKEPVARCEIYETLKEVPSPSLYRCEFAINLETGQILKARSTITFKGVKIS